MNPKPLVLKFGLFLLLMIPLMIGACTNEVQIRKSALKYFNEGNSALKHRDYQAAIWNYQKAISLDSETPNFHYNLGLTYYEIANYKESIDSFKRVEMLVPSQSDTYYNLALAYNKISESRMADFYYNRYQDMLSLRKAQERLEEVRKEQEREKRITESEAKKTVLKNNTAVSAKKPRQEKKSKKGKSGIPSWE
tara:strand:- start:3957 stop:4538 length:582 start_codon:yes stop_codon:yes gene_type:complete